MASTEWVQRRWAGRALGLGVLLAPSLVALAVGYGASRFLGGRELPLRVVMTAAVVAVAVLAHLGTARLLRRVLPLAALLRLTLVFPDRAPSRMAVALRANQAQQLRQRIEAGVAAREDPPSQVAADLLAIVAFLTAHDRRTRGHAERVRAYSDVIAQQLGFSPAERRQLAWAALLHDVGKIGVPAELLNKPGRLTRDELELVRRHAAIGHCLVAPLADWLGECARVPLEHHEFFDGSGYPAGRAGLDISLPARIVSVADAFDVMTSTRAYARGRGAAAARAELVRCAGSQFDPAVVRAFLTAGVDVADSRGAAVSGALSPGWMALRWSAAVRDVAGGARAGLGILAAGGAGALLPIEAGAEAKPPAAVSVPAKPTAAGDEVEVAAPLAPVSRLVPTGEDLRSVARSLVRPDEPPPGPAGSGPPDAIPLPVPDPAGLFDAPPDARLDATMVAEAVDVVTGLTAGPLDVSGRTLAAVNSPPTPSRPLPDVPVGAPTATLLSPDPRVDGQPTAVLERAPAVG